MAIYTFHLLPFVPVPSNTARTFGVLGSKQDMEKKLDEIEGLAEEQQSEQQQQESEAEERQEQSEQHQQEREAEERQEQSEQYQQESEAEERQEQQENHAPKKRGRPPKKVEFCRFNKRMSNQESVRVTEQLLATFDSHVTTDILDQTPNTPSPQPPTSPRPAGPSSYSPDLFNFPPSSPSLHPFGANLHSTPKSNFITVEPSACPMTQDGTNPRKRQLSSTFSDDFPPKRVRLSSTSALNDISM